MSFRDEVRAAIRARRNELTIEEQLAASNDLVPRALSVPGVTAASHVAATRPFRNEISPMPLVETLVERGSNTYLPIVDDGEVMSYAAWKPGDPLVSGRFGIEEPVSGAQVRAVTELDLVLAPLLAVDRRGYRLGWGKGHYDRAFSGPSRPLLIGLCFDFQVIEHVEEQAWDIPLDIIVTPAEWISCIR